ncbi:MULTISPECIES: SDR family NAD(P)-dependent oxidoreductase [unclassified Ensifer]|uniref:SDR family NAD(P)-dependent oxidoreductase n=1 Tax=unclassified Ensifer TaxID=2633371 RepID=UPI0008135DAE|nr:MULTISPECIES: SDR family NAD(P)-dependent oxidoreductase [unclassified Ensifer]OCP24206.1 oxidoreductase [Ensifer sp. LC384]OCP25562.1 oxidoreductase [Ensifer sp. LC54]
MSMHRTNSEHGLAWVTGASSGMGRALALRLVRGGYSVVVTSRNHDKLVALQHEAAADGRIIVLDGDVTDPQDMDRVLASIEYEHGDLSLAVFTAGVTIPVRGDDLHREAFERSFAVNVNGVVNCLLPAVAHMKARGHGHIAIVSGAAGYGGLPGNAAYGATKAALINLAESLKSDLERIGIRLQLINPGLVDTIGSPRPGLPRSGAISADEAAEHIIRGLKSKHFEISFPKRSTTMAKISRLLPYGVYFALVDRLSRQSAAPAMATTKRAGAKGRPHQAV